MHNESKSPSDEFRFKETISDDYQLVERTVPHFNELQGRLSKFVAEYCQSSDKTFLNLLEIGCGGGYTTYAISSCCPNLIITAIDNEPKMLESAKSFVLGHKSFSNVKFILADAREFLQSTETDSFDIVASALTYHNWEKCYRTDVLTQIYRVLKPGGSFANADKYVIGIETAHQQFKARLDKYFEVLLPLGKYELLREWVLHETEDMSYERLMNETDSKLVMERIGYLDIQVPYRESLEAILIARKKNG